VKNIYLYIIFLLFCIQISGIFIHFNFSNYN